MHRFNRAAPAVVFGILGALLILGCQGQDESAAKEWTEIMPGLSYVDSVVGEGVEAGPTDFVLAHYTGWLWEDGQKSGEPFDSSVTRGEPIAFPLGRSMVIQGWDKGLPGMKVGGKRTLLISPEMGYGERGYPPVIPENATLIFDIELVDVPRVDVEVLEEGTGPEAENGDMLQVHYTGWLWKDGEKGSQFDSSVSRGAPFEFPLGQSRVIPGWDIGLEGMKVGTKARLIIPAELGYGKRGSPPKIPGGSTLCFEVELVGIQGK